LDFTTYLEPRPYASGLDLNHGSVTSRKSGNALSSSLVSKNVERKRSGRDDLGKAGVTGRGKALVASNDVGDSLGIGTAFTNPDSMWVCQGGRGRCMNRKKCGL
jgi:hypothetical protein